MSDRIITPGGPDHKTMQDHHNELTAEIVAACQKHQNHLPLALIVGVLNTLAMDFHTSAFQAAQAQQLQLAQAALNKARQIRESDA